MSNLTGGLMMLSEMLHNLPPSEKKIASYILEFPKETLDLTVSELGKRSQTSGAAVIRLCKSLDLKGFPELKLRIAGDLQQRVNTVIEFRDIEPNENVISILEKVTNNTTQTLRETAELVSISELEKAVEVIQKADNVHFYGVGASSIIAQDAQQKFLRINKSTTAFSDAHMAATIIANAKKNDVVFGISFSGQTYEVAKILELANQKSVKTISLTKFGTSPVADQANIRLYTSSTQETAFRSGATSSRIAQLHIIDILFMSVASRQYKKTIRHVDETKEAVEFLRTRIKPRKNGVD
ncbi:MurR/RpiR family transcriptional regulator [Heyndrickxia acidicola]|uniref:MurR/RpiR family transcriptional regulator n=1 Tax=Heyndrickxia acidicola TaxID=209389 RepID=A0ABU6MGJ2_9BACI|nr:MurR/RpiR family transcriptional regulator [Heyndrickxia acidicola]MED1202783.1 MurR/RpiR family transcriptional regulator [Heyndrickxia acidicola]